MLYKNKNIVVVGLGSSGYSCACLLAKRGANVTVIDDKKKSELSGNIARLPENVRTIPSYRTSAQSTGKYDMAVLSPGVPQDHPFIKEAKKKGVPLVSEIELAYTMLPRGTPVVAITGTNGKTTTVELASKILASLKGKKILAGGNIGTPLASLVGRVKRNFILVLELSSYQLETIDTFHPRVSVILNITPDHLERYASMNDYALAKAKVFLRQKNGDFCILNADDGYCTKLKGKVRCRKLFFSMKRELKNGIFMKGNHMICRTGFLPERRYEISSGLIKIPGPHNIENIMACILIGHIFRVSRAEIEKTIASFRGVEHRLEFVRRIRGVTFINDSKATNVDSTKRALQTFSSPTVLIMGGRHKGSSYKPLYNLVKKKVKTLVLCGESAPRIRKDLAFSVRMVTVRNMRQAVNTAFSQASAGDMVLLSPACSSFDQFSNFEERGEVFRKWVKKLKA